MKIQKSKKENLEQQAVDIITKKLSQVINEKGKGVLVVPGGSSVSGVFSLLSLSELDWKNIHIFLADERWVPLDDKDSNYKNLEERLLSKINIPNENVHKFDISKGIEDYQNQFIEQGNIIDVCLLGVGPDDHVASLFPNHPSIEYDKEGYFEVSNSPKDPPRRISLSKRTIEKSETIILLIFGEEKRGALNNFMDNDLDIISCPSKIAKEGNNRYLFTDIV